MALPDFLVIGAAKSGTTALHYYLLQHPQIFMAEKEPRYFAYDPDGNVGEWHEDYGPEYFAYRTQAEYETLFADAQAGQLLGEASPLYLESEIAARNIHTAIPDSKLIASLRNPADRAVSGYMMQVRNGREHRAIEDAFDKDAHYVKASFYYPQVKRYMDLFPREQIRIYLFEEFKRNNSAILREIFEFLDVDATFQVNTEKKHNVGTYPKSRLLNSLLMNPNIRRVVKPITPGWIKQGFKNLRRMNMTQPPEVSEEIRAQIRELFRDDILKLQDLLQQDLSIWLEGKSVSETA